MSAVPARQSYEEELHNESLKKEGKISFPERNIPYNDSSSNSQDTNQNRKIQKNQINDNYSNFDRKTGVKIPENYQKSNSNLDSDNNQSLDNSNIKDNNPQEISNSLAYKKRKAQKAAQLIAKQEAQKVAGKAVKKGSMTFIRFLFFTPEGWVVLTFIAEAIAIISLIITVIVTFMSMAQTCSDTAGATFCSWIIDFI